MWLRHIHHPRDYLSISEKDGVWDSSYVSTGVYDETGVNNVLGGATQSDLGNGEVSYGYNIRYNRGNAKCLYGEAGENSIVSATSKIFFISS